MANIIAPRYFKELSEQNPMDVCKRSLCRHDAEKKTYSVNVWGYNYEVRPHKKQITCTDNKLHKHHDYLSLAVIYYLLRSKEITPSNEWISEKDIPGGAAFFRGPHELPTHLISVKFNGKTDEFKRICEQIGGSELDLADAAYVFNILSRIPVAILFWDGDEDFPSESKLLFDRSIRNHLSLDIIFALAVSVCSEIRQQAN